MIKDMNDIYYDYVDYWKKEGELSQKDSLSFRLTNEHEAQEALIRQSTSAHGAVTKWSSWTTNLFL